jgi:hemerythrin-like domain-containing protein
MTDMVEILRQEHRNIESLLRVLERELSVFDRGERPDYEVVLAVIDYFKDYPEACHQPKEDMIVEKLKARDPVAASTIGDLEAEHQEGTKRLHRVAQAVERVLSDQDLLRQNVDNIIRDFVNHRTAAHGHGGARRLSGRAQRAAARGLGRYCSKTRRPLRPVLPAGV